MKTMNIENEETNEIKQSVIKTSGSTDGVEYSVSDFDSQENFSQNAQPIENDAEAMRRIERKGDVATAIATLVLNVVPIVSDAIKHKNSPNGNKPYMVKREHVTKLAVNTGLSALVAIDSMCGRKLQNAIDSKSPVSLKDARNIVSMIQVYPAIKSIATNLSDNATNKAFGRPEVQLNPNVKSDLWMNIANITVPFFASKLVDDRLTMQQKITSIMPTKMIGSFVKRFAATNPNVQRAYNTAEALVSVASFGNNKLSNAVRATPGSTVNKASGIIGNSLEFVSDIMGMNTGRINGNYYGGGYGNAYGGNGFHL